VAQKKQAKLGEAPPWMWALGLLGLALTLGSVGFLLYEAAAGDNSPPDVSVRVESVAQNRNGYLVRIRAVNEGGSTAAGLTVEGELFGGGRSVETSDTVIEYLPPHSEREVGLFFTTDPRAHELRLRAKGYEKP
jgi:uncharacterized protein (TIGR02588 family)